MGKIVKSPPSPPPPPPPMGSSHTRREIERFWRKKRLVEEEHLLAAIKAAARRRASQLSEEDYKLFLESLDETQSIEEGDTEKYVNNQENRVGIKDWWTKSKYAYLNQPAIGTVKPSRKSNYTPYNIFLCNYKILSSPISTASSKAAFLDVY